MKIVRAEPMRRHSFYDVQLGLIDRLLVNSERENPDFYRRMFDQDFASLFRPTNRQSGNLFKIVSNNDELTQRLLGNVSTGYSLHQVNKSVRELMKDIAEALIRFGTTYYFLQDITEQGGVHLVPFSSSGVIRLLGMHIQWVPKRTARHLNRDDEELPREVRILDAAKVICFDMPKSIKRMLSAQNRTLAVLDKHRFGVDDFMPRATHENPNPTTYFDFPVWSDAQGRAFYRATRGTGWDGRKDDALKCSDFFKCHRLIRFRRNQLMLRDDIMRQLSVQLSRVGKSYEAEFSVEISGTEGLPSGEHLNELELRLTREEVGFTEILDYCYEC